MIRVILDSFMQGNCRKDGHVICLDADKVEHLCQLFTPVKVMNNAASGSTQTSVQRRVKSDARLLGVASLTDPPPVILVCCVITNYL